MSEQPKPSFPLPYRRRRGMSPGRLAEIGALLVLLVAASGLVYLLLRAVCCGQ